MVELILHAMELPRHWMMPRLETEWYISIYERISNANPLLLELAKLDFNIIQSIHQNDFENSIKVVEGHRGCRKAVIFKGYIDDIHDVYGTLDELEHFTDVIQRWDMKATEQLPEYMKECYLPFFNIINDMAYQVIEDQGINVLPYLTKSRFRLRNSVDRGEGVRHPSIPWFDHGRLVEHIG
ncbi:putative (-)-camphene/tricyclene synthase, chloroplastic-like [Capsicum annuum]|nr:putative (-)-camphene/tricyclene synthase, chloroplastic-like [Capsicum annuum]